MGYIRTTAHNQKISNRMILYYSNPENRLKAQCIQKGLKNYKYDNYDEIIIKRKGVLYYRFCCKGCGRYHYTQKIKGKPRCPLCHSCAARLRGKGKVHSKETRDKISKTLMGHEGSRALKGRPKTKESIKKRDNTILKKYGKYPSYKKGFKVSDETKRKISENTRKMWRDPNSKVNNSEYREGLLQRVKDLRPLSKMNKKEMYLEYILEIVCPQQYKYNGAGQLGLRIYRHIPDFINVNGQKKIIDLHGCAWHCCESCHSKHPMGKNESIIREQDAKHIINAKYLGYRVLVIWEHELSNEEALISKIKQFNEES